MSLALKQISPQNLFQKGQPWLVNPAPSGKLSTWDKPENRIGAMNWAYLVYRHKTDAGELGKSQQVHDITDLTQTHIGDASVIGKSFRGLLSYRNFPGLMMEAFPYEFSIRFRDVLRPWMLQEFRHWDIQHRIEMTQSTIRRIVKNKPLFFVEKEDFTVNNPFGHNYARALEQIYEAYGAYSHWLLLAEASVIVPDNATVTNPLSTPFSLIKERNGRRFWLTEDRLNQIYSTARHNLSRLPDRRNRMLELYLQGFSFEQIGHIFGVTRQAIEQALNYSEPLTQEEKDVHGVGRRVIRRKRFMMDLFEKIGVDNLEGSLVDAYLNINTRALARKTGYPPKVVSWYLDMTGRIPVTPAEAALKELMALRESGVDISPTNVSRRHRGLYVRLIYHYGYAEALRLLEIEPSTVYKKGRYAKAI